MNNKDLSRHRTVLLRYAFLHLHGHAAAEDVVQETLLAALRGNEGFRSESAVRTWLIGILKHKIADHYRAVGKQHVPGETIGDDSNPNEALEQLIFNGKGHWIGTPGAWSEPDYALEQDEFWVVFEWCQQNLPKQHALVLLCCEK
ncbi:sigma factor [Crenothrix sp.]|uniref:sigma factor n=1 Tax=Crenothrix sp. TaxID=3100433 RepID=UPI00374D1ED6